METRKVYDNHGRYEVSTEQPNVVYGVAIKRADRDPDEPLFIEMETQRPEQAEVFIKDIQKGRRYGTSDVTEILLVEKSIKLLRIEKITQEKKCRS